MCLLLHENRGHDHARRRTRGKPPRDRRGCMRRIEPPCVEKCARSPLVDPPMVGQMDCRFVEILHWFDAFDACDHPQQQRSRAHPTLFRQGTDWR